MRNVLLCLITSSNFQWVKNKIVTSHGLPQNFFPTAMTFTTFFFLPPSLLHVNVSFIFYIFFQKEVLMSNIYQINTSILTFQQTYHNPSTEKSIAQNEFMESFMED